MQNIKGTVTRNTLDCEFVTNVMYTPRALFCRLFLKICRFTGYFHYGCALRCVALRGERVTSVEALV